MGRQTANREGRKAPKTPVKGKPANAQDSPDAGTQQARSLADGSRQVSGLGVMQRLADRYASALPTVEGAPVQARLSVGQPGDRFEREADQVASSVVRQMANPADAPLQAAPEEEIQAKPSAEVLHRRSDPAKAPAKGGGVSDGFETAVQRSKGGGKSLDTGLQDSMGKAMGADFSAVRVHTDGQADRLSQSIQAKAFTTGSDVYFKKGAYDPGSKPGQELIAHELTHVVQQGSAGVQRKDAPDISTGADSGGIQRAMEQAFMTDTAQLHNLKTNDKDDGTVSGGPKLKSGDLVMADEADQRGGGVWIKAEARGKTGYLRQEKVLMKRVVDATALTDPGMEGTSTMDAFEETTDGIGGSNDAAATGVEQGYVKANVDGRLEEIKGDGKNDSAIKAKGGLDIASGVGDTFTGLFGMVSAAKELSSNSGFWKKAGALFELTEATAKATAGTTKVVDASAKLKGSGGKGGGIGGEEDTKDVAGSDDAGKLTGAISDGLSAVKNAALGVIGLYRLFTSQSDEKGKDAAKTFKSFTSAALSAAKVAKNAYDIIGNGIPMAVIYTVPALSIAVSAINAIIRLADALKSGDTSAMMEVESNAYMTDLALALGEPVPTEQTVGSSSSFFGESRGTFPVYHHYIRTKKGVRAGVRETLAKADQEKANLDTKRPLVEAIVTSAEGRRDGLRTRKTEMESVLTAADSRRNGQQSTNAEFDAILAFAESRFGSVKPMPKDRLYTSVMISDARRDVETKIDASARLSATDKAALKNVLRGEDMAAIRQKLGTAAGERRTAISIDENTALAAEIDAFANLTPTDKASLKAAVSGDDMAATRLRLATVAGQRQTDSARDEKSALSAEIDAAALHDDEKTQLKGLLQDPTGADDFEAKVVADLKGKWEEKLSGNATALLRAAIGTIASLPPTAQTALANRVEVAGNIAEFPVKSKDKLQEVDTLVSNYEFTDKMAEINSKRKTNAWTDFAQELINMAGDIVTIAVGATGVGAAVGQGMKAVAAGVRVVHAGSKYIQKLYRNRGDGTQDEHSDAHKHAEYVEHARYIYKQIAALDPTNPQAEEPKRKKLETYIRATGVNYGMWVSLRGKPQQSVEMLVEAMKER